MMYKIALRSSLVLLIANVTWALLLMGGACQGVEWGNPGERVGANVAPLSFNTNVVFDANIVAPTINSVIYVDGVHYPLNTAGINAAIGDAPTGGTVHMPAGSYSLSCSCDGCSCDGGVINVNKVLTLEGDGWGTVLQPNGDVDSGTDIINITIPLSSSGGPDDPEGAGVVLRNFVVIPAADAGTPGQNGIVINTPQNGGVSSMMIDHVWIAPLGNYAIYGNNSTPVLNGFFQSTIQNSRLYGGINLSNAGDSISIIHNAIVGNAGVSVSFVGGATSLAVEQNNIVMSTINPGILVSGNAEATRILRNEIEWEGVDAGATAPPFIKVDGPADGGPANGVVVSGNSIQYGNSGAVTNGAIFVNSAWGTIITDNWFASHPAGGAYDIYVSDAGLNTIIGTNIGNTVTSGDPGAVTVSDNGTNTVGASVQFKLDGRGSLFLAAEAACLGSGVGAHFLTWNPDPSNSCGYACSHAYTGELCFAASCVQGWSLWSGTSNYRYGDECDAGNTMRGISGMLCCCMSSDCGQPLYR